MDKVEEFIHKRFKTNCKWMSDNSYYFAVILKSRFPRGTICYDVIEGYFLLYLHGCLYDYKGKHEVNHGGHRYVIWNMFEEYDLLQKEYITREFIEQEVFK